MVPGGGVVSYKRGTPVQDGSVADAAWKECVRVMDKANATQSLHT